MRVLLWAAAYPPSRGGVESMTGGLAASLAERGHVVEVVTPAGNSRPSTTVGVVTVHRLPFHHALTSRDPEVLAGVAGRVAAIRRELRPDLVNLHAMHPGWYFHLRSGHRGPVLYTSHGWSDVGTGPTTLTGRILRASDRIVCCSDFVAGEGRRLVPEVADRITTLLNGVPPVALDAAAPARRRGHLVAASRLEPTKGVTDLLDAVEMIVGDVPGLEVTVVGTGSLERELRRRVSRAPLRGVVTLAGATEPGEVRRYMATATAVVVPSRPGDPPSTSEPFGLVAAEAALAGRPVVATRVGGLPEIVIDGLTGLLVEPGRVVALASALVRVLTDERLAARLGPAARRYAAARFDWERHVDAYEDLYRTMTGER